MNTEVVLEKTEEVLGAEADALYEEVLSMLCRMEEILGEFDADGRYFFRMGSILSEIRYIEVRKYESPRQFAIWSAACDFIKMMS